MLIIMKNWDIKKFPEATFNFKTSRSRNIF